MVIDLRGPAVIYSTELGELLGKWNKRGSMRKSNSQETNTSEWVTYIHFSIMNLEGESKPILARKYRPLTNAF